MPRMDTSRAPAAKWVPLTHLGLKVRFTLQLLTQPSIHSAAARASPAAQPQSHPALLALAFGPALQHSSRAPKR